MRNHALWTIMTGLSLLVCVGCSTTDHGGVIRGQDPACQSCPTGGCLDGGYAGCLDGSCYGDGYGDCYGDCNGGCFGGHCGGHGWKHFGHCDKWSQCNVHHYNSSMVPQCNVGTAMPMMVQYPYYTTKGPSDFFYCGD